MGAVRCRKVALTRAACELDGQTGPLHVRTIFDDAIMSDIIIVEGCGRFNVRKAIEDGQLAS